MSKATVDADDVNSALKEYLEAIYELEEEKQPLLQVNVANRLGISRPSVSEAVKRLVANGNLTIGDSHELLLTKQGRALAEIYVRRHRLAERLLTDLLGIPWHKAHEQAHDWEKVMTAEVEVAILAKLSDEPTCPHGNPIPGTPTKLPWNKLKPINALTQGEEAKIVRLLEDIELDNDAMLFLENNHLMPNHELVVTQPTDGENVVIDIDQQAVTLTDGLASRIWVLPAR